MSPAGYLFTYWNSKASKEREAQIDRVNAQVPFTSFAAYVDLRSLTQIPASNPVRMPTTMSASHAHILRRSWYTCPPHASMRTLYTLIRIEGWETQVRLFSSAEYHAIT